MPLLVLRKICNKITHDMQIDQLWLSTLHGLDWCGFDVRRVLKRKNVLIRGVDRVQIERDIPLCVEFVETVTDASYL